MNEEKLFVGSEVYFGKWNNCSYSKSEKSDFWFFEFLNPMLKEVEHVESENNLVYSLDDEIEFSTGEDSETDLLFQERIKVQSEVFKTSSVNEKDLEIFDGIVYGIFSSSRKKYAPYYEVQKIKD